MREPSEFEIYTKPPESINVGTLNNIVHILREKLYEQKLATQTAQDRASRLEFPDKTGQ